MVATRRQLIESICNSALDVPPGERKAFVAEACAGDDELKEDVDRLLAKQRDATGLHPVPEPEKTVEQPAPDDQGESCRDAVQTAASAGGDMLVGGRIGPYQILEFIGAGGMGEVYRVCDTRLNRVAALKILPANMATDEDRVRRFSREARASSTLAHPNIATIYDVGQCGDIHFIAMEFVEGQTLAAKIASGPLDTGEILEVALHVCDALDAAHSKGVIHRDIKPTNIMVTTRGQVKVLDFGLAKMTRPVAQTDSKEDISTQSSNAPGAVRGTVQYMSPEQALGHDLDCRSDIFSFGVTMYEMATGRKPFSGSSANEIIDRIIHTLPEAIARFNYDTPQQLEYVIRKCMQKDPGRRYQSTGEVLVDLKNLKRDIDSGSIATELTAPRPRHRFRRIAFVSVAAAACLAAVIYFLARSDKPSAALAILPFANVSADPNAEFVTDGLTEGLINDLSQVPNLTVIARNTVFQYKGEEHDLREVGKQLAVQFVLTGRVLLQNDNLSVRVELVEVRKNRQIWGERYETKLSDLVGIQEAISRETADRLQLSLTGDQQKHLAKRYNVNSEVFQLYLRGRYFLNKRTPDEVRKAASYFEEARAKDSNFALAYAGLADAYNILGDYDYLRPSDTLPHAKAQALAALAIDDTLAEAHTALAHVKMYELEWLEAKEEFKRAIGLNPNYSTARQWYANCLMALGNTEEALAQIRVAMKVDSLSLTVNQALGFLLYLARDYPAAIEQYRKALELDPTFVPSHSGLGTAYLQTERYDDAVREFERAIELTNGATDYVAALGRAYALAGRRRKALETLNGLEKVSHSSYVSPYYIALIHSALGDKDLAFEWMDKACIERSSFLFFLRVDPSVDALRSDPRFRMLERRMKLAS